MVTGPTALLAHHHKFIDSAKPNRIRRKQSKYIIATCIFCLSIGVSTIVARGRNGQGHATRAPPNFSLFNRIRLWLHLVTLVSPSPWLWSGFKLEIYVIRGPDEFWTATAAPFMGTMLHVMKEVSIYIEWRRRRCLTSALAIFLSTDWRFATFS